MPPQPWRTSWRRRAVGMQRWTVGIDALPSRVDATATETEARRLAQDVARTVQAALLAQTAPAAVTDAFCASWLGGDWGHAFGTLGSGMDLDAILHRAMPVA